MARCASALFILLFLLLTGCGVSDRLARVEKENKELKEEVSKRSTISDYDLQAKCAKDARAWFEESWQRDSGTILLDYTNHYNKAMNKCFILVEFHFNTAPSGSWTNSMTISDVYENLKYGTYMETHRIRLKDGETSDQLHLCKVMDKECKSIQEFNTLVGPYMNN